MKSFPFIQQLGIKDCGPACLKMIAQWYGKHYDLNYLRQKCNITKIGVSMLGITEAAEVIGFRTMGIKVAQRSLKSALDSGPCILHWKQNHFVVLYSIKKRGAKIWYYIADPAKGKLKLTQKEFSTAWNNNSNTGIALLLEPTPIFYEPNQMGEAQKANFSLLWPYFKKYQRYYWQIVFGMTLGSIITLASPFITQALVDNGIGRQDLHFVYLILLAQLVLFIGSTFIDIIRSWILMHIGTRINISMVSNFFKKIMNLPIPFYDQFVVGDLMQRIDDHSKIEALLTINTLSTLFSFINILALGSILFFYNNSIFTVFFIGAALGLGWIILFLKKRRNLDFKFFEAHSNNNNKVLEILSAVQDIKIANATRQKRWEWEVLQSKLYQIKMNSLTLNQIQGLGSSFINRLANIVITFLAAKLVIDGEITLGTMFAITMIVGQISSPIQQILGFVTTLQDARIALERINDIITKKDEDPSQQNDLREVPLESSIIMENVNFYYGSETLKPVLYNFNLQIESGKITAIVGTSGSGKTTLIKLLLKFYNPNSGNIMLDGYHFKSLHHGAWRENCGVVMQDGQLLSGTIADNICLGRSIEISRLMEAARLANIDAFINDLPLGYLTEIGPQGTQVSTGQKQRILLARAIYKNPAYLFLDEATSALDSDNEKKIIENLNIFFQHRTVVVVAHRLSTVKNADKIVVLEKGNIVETGTHQQLVNKRGAYYELVKNQLELAN